MRPSHPNILDPVLDDGDVLLLGQTKTALCFFWRQFIAKSSSEEEKAHCCPMNLIAISEPPLPPHAVRPPKVLQKWARCTVWKGLHLQL